MSDYQRTPNEEVLALVVGYLHTRHGFDGSESTDEWTALLVSGAGPTFVAVHLTCNCDLLCGDANGCWGTTFTSNMGAITEDRPENYHLEDRLNALRYVPNSDPTGYQTKRLTPPISSTQLLKKSIGPETLAKQIAAILDEMAKNTNAVINSLSIGDRQCLSLGTQTLTALEKSNHAE